MKLASLRYTLRYRVPSALRALRDDWQETAAPRFYMPIRYVPVRVADVDRAIRESYTPDVLAGLTYVDLLEDIE